ncbi:MAG: RloB family protein, partial [Opitutaceae bacterium]|jgi:hypothetical protein|nr:RloB family protein [Opitutaceae bacterium]
LAHSTPCFETWLLFHFGRTTRADLPDGKAAKTALKKELGRDYATDKKTANAVMPAFIAKWPLAVQAAEFARRHHAASNTPAPANPSTEVDRLVLTMNDSTHPASRKIP